MGISTVHFYDLGIQFKVIDTHEKQKKKQTKEETNKKVIVLNSYLST